MFPEKIHKKKLTKTSLKQNLKGQKKNTDNPWK